MKEIDNILYERLSPDIYCLVHNQLVKLKQENQQLKDNWNKLKEYAKDNLYFYSGYQGADLEIDIAIQGVLDKMQELERSVINVED